MKALIAILTVTLLVACSEEQVFDTSFKASARYFLAGYCQSNDSSCIASVDQYIDLCFKESGYDPAMIQGISNQNWPNPQEMNKNTDFSKLHKFKTKMNNCMPSKIGGSYAQNIKQGNANWISDVKITRTQNRSIDCILNPKSCDKSKLIKIQLSKIIKINNKQTPLSEVTSTLLNFKTKTPKAYIELIKYNQIDDSMLVALKQSIKKADMKISSTSWIYKSN